MNAHFLISLACFILIRCAVQANAQSEIGHESDLKMTLRTHSLEVFVGDPVYIEVSILNEGKYPVRAMSFNHSNVEFRVRSDGLGLETDCLLGTAAQTFGESGRQFIDYLPNQPVRKLFRVFLPTVGQLRKSFWREAPDSGSVDIRCYFWIRRSIKLNSVDASIRIKTRPEEELLAIERWSQPPPIPKSRMDTKVLFGMARLLSVRSRQDTKEFAGAVKTGEFAEFAKYILRLQDLESSVNREVDSQVLVEWLRTQPDVKREWLAEDLLAHPGLVADSALPSIKEIVAGEPLKK